MICPKEFPLVSVVMPARDCAFGDKLPWFGQAILSIVKQDYRGPIEIVLVDDGSKDPTPNFYLTWKRQMETSQRKFQYYRIRQSGVTRALNHGLGKSEGEFIARLDSDDWSEPSRISKQVSFLQEHPEVGLIGTPVRIVRSHTVTREMWNVLTEHEDLVRGLRERNRFAHSSVMFRKAVLESVGCYDENYPYAQDWDFWWRIAQKFRVAQLNEPLTYYRIHRGSVSQGKQTSHQQNAFAVQIKRRILSGALA